MTTVTTVTIRAVSYGGGVQSTALLVLAAQRVIDFPLFLMANVGDDSEDPRTLEYVDDVARPYAEANGIELVVLDRRTRDGKVETLWGRLMREESRSLPIPVRMSNGAPGNRSCTADFKIRVITKELKRRGAHGPLPCRAHRPAQRAAQREAIAAGKTAREAGETPPPVPLLFDVEGCDACQPANQATVGIGISLDEIQRAASRRVEPHERVVYPLVGLGEETGLKLRRDDCTRIIRQAGLPVPPKSSCFFCPFHRPEAWSDLHRERPDLFERSALLEDTLNARRDKLGKDHVFLTRFGIPLREAIDQGQDLLPFIDEDPADGTCETGHCFT